MRLADAIANLLDAIGRRIAPRTSSRIDFDIADIIDPPTARAMTFLTPDDPKLPKARYRP